MFEFWVGIAKKLPRSIEPMGRRSSSSALVLQFCSGSISTSRLVSLMFEFCCCQLTTVAVLTMLRHLQSALGFDLGGCMKWKLPRPELLWVSLGEYCYGSSCETSSCEPLTLHHLKCQYEFQRGKHESRREETWRDGPICAPIEESPLGFFRTFMPQLTEVASKQQFWIGQGKFVVYLEPQTDSITLHGLQKCNRIKVRLSLKNHSVGKATSTPLAT